MLFGSSFTLGQQRDFALVHRAGQVAKRVHDPGAGLGGHHCPRGFAALLVLDGHDLCQRREALRDEGIQLLQQALLGRVDDQAAEVLKVGLRCAGEARSVAPVACPSRHEVHPRRRLCIGNGRVQLAEPRAHLLRSSHRLCRQAEFGAGAIGDATADHQQHKRAGKASGDLQFDRSPCRRRGFEPRIAVAAGQQAADAQQNEGHRRVQGNRRQHGVRDQFAGVPGIAEQTHRADRQHQQRQRPHEPAQPADGEHRQRESDGAESERAVGRHAARDRVVGLRRVANQELVDAQLPREQILPQRCQAQHRHADGERCGQGRTPWWIATSAKKQSAAREHQSEGGVGFHFNRAADDTLEPVDTQAPTCQHAQADQHGHGSGRLGAAEPEGIQDGPRMLGVRSLLSTASR